PAGGAALALTRGFRILTDREARATMLRVLREMEAAGTAARGSGSDDSSDGPSQVPCTAGSSASRGSAGACSSASASGSSSGSSRSSVSSAISVRGGDSPAPTSAGRSSDSSKREAKLAKTYLAEWREARLRGVSAAAYGLPEAALFAAYDAACLADNATD